MKTPEVLGPGEINKDARWVNIHKVREGLIITHAERLKQGMEKEKQIGIPLKTTEDTIKAMSEILNDLKQDYMDAGMMQKGTEKIKIESDFEGVVGSNAIDKVFNGLPKSEISKIAGEVGKQLVDRIRENNRSPGHEDSGPAKA